MCIVEHLRSIALYISIISFCDIWHNLILQKSRTRIFARGRLADCRHNSEFFEIEKYYQPGAHADDSRTFGKVTGIWGNLYRKGDYAQSHSHKSFDYSFAYFVKAKWYDSPLIFDDSGKRIRPKEGRYVIFPGYLSHNVPKNRYNHERVTLSGNYLLSK